jgi:HD-like signal output (HDOD) protein
MDKLTIIDEIQKSSELLSMPQAISELLREMERQNFSADALSRIILKDASLTSRILKLANSPYYHRLSEITTVSQAIQVLGSNTVKCLALSSSVFNPATIEKASGIDVRAFFASVMRVAAAAEKIAKEIGYKAPDEAFIAGLLHHIGIMFFLHHYPESYRRVIERKVKARTLVDAEHEVFGVDHCEIGYHLARRWNLPDYIGTAIRDHHDFTEASPRDAIQNIIRLATLMTDDAITTYIADLEDRMMRVNEVSERIGLSKDSVDRLSSSLLAETMRVAEYLDIDIGSIEEILTHANKELWATYLMVENLFKERQELSAKLLKEERDKGAVQSKNIAIATMSHYLNNATMAIYGRAQIMRKQLDSGSHDRLIEKMPATLDVIERSIKKIKAVLLEIGEISPIDEVKFYNMSQALNLDERIAARMESLDSDTGLVLPKEVAEVHE